MLYYHIDIYLYLQIYVSSFSILEEPGSLFLIVIGENESCLLLICP